MRHGLVGSEPRADYLAIAFEHTTRLITVLSPEGIFLEANRAVCEFVQLPAEELIGRSVWDMASSSGIEQFRVAWNRALLGETVQYRSSDRRTGRTVWFDITLTPVLDARGDIGLVVSEARDVTEIELAEREVRLSREKYAGIVDISADAIISLDEALRITDFNKGAERIFGYAAGEIVGEPLDLLIPERFRTAHRSHIRAFGTSSVDARRMGERQGIWGIRKGGDEFPADASISKQVIDGQRVYTVVLRDNSLPKQLESVQRFLARAGSLLASSLNVATTFDSVASLAADFIADCCVIYDAREPGAPRRVAVATRVPAKEAVLNAYRGRPLRLDSQHPVMRVLETGEPLLLQEAEVAASSTGDGDAGLLRELPVRSAMFVPLGARGRTWGAIAFFNVASESRFDTEDVGLAQQLASRASLAIDNAQLYQSAKDAISARDDVLAVVSHDLGNPLSAIRIGVSLLLRNTTHGRQGEGWEHLSGIKQSVEQMERLIRDLLDIKRIEAGHLSLDWKPLRPALLVNSVIEMFAAIAAQKSIALKARVATRLPAVRADRERIIQVLSNLIGNALKFTPKGGVIEVHASSVDRHVLFSVRDNGAGITPEDLEHIFDRFWRARRMQRESGAGLGLGLAIVKGIVQAHGGRVWAESQPQQGTAVYFTIPTVREAAPA